jgi:glycosyltransferase involved in cell wall biosynthesis
VRTRTIASAASRSLPDARVAGAPVSVVRVIARLNVGGPAQHVVTLTAGLDRFPTLLVAGPVSDGEADMSALATRKGVQVYWIPELGRRVRPWHDLVALFKLYALFRRERPRIVHTHTAKGGTLGRLAAAMAGVPVRVHTFHGHVFRGYFSARTSRMVIAVERLMARLSTRIVTISESQAQEISEEFRICPRSKVEVVPLGLDLERFRPARVAPLRGLLRKELGIGRTPVISIVGRLAPIKNHALLLRAAAELKRTGRDFVVLVAGGGSEEAALRSLTHELGLDDTVRFLGWVEDLERIYADSDLVVLTSNNEGTPVCLIEALASGRRVVATDVGGVSDVLEAGRFGALVAPGDVQGLVSALQAELSVRASDHSTATVASARMFERFGSERLIHDMESLYEQLTRNFPRSTSMPFNSSRCII